MEKKGPSADLSALSRVLVSPRVGIVKDLRLIPLEASEPPQPYVMQSLMANHRFSKKDDPRKGGASGKGLTIASAQERALGEAVERYSSIFYRPEEITYSRRAGLPGRSLDPRELVLYRPEQYAHVDYLPYTEDSLIGWARGRSLASGEMVFVPASAVFMGYDAKYKEENILGTTSNGLATGGSLPSAVFSAAMEVIERDAFLIGWNHRLTVARWEPGTHPDPEFRRLHQVYKRCGIGIELYQMPTDLSVAVFLALGIAEDERDLPAAVVGLGAHPDPATSAWKAFLEVGQIRPAQRRRLRAPALRERMAGLLADPTLVKEMEDHDLLYSNPGALSKFEFLRKTPVTRTDWGAGEPERDLKWLVEHLRAKGHDLIYFDLTPHDMRRLGLYTARALIPGFQPIDFGFYQFRQGGQRLYRLPFELGLREEIATSETLNPDPHPLA